MLDFAILLCFLLAHFEFASQIVLDIHRGCAADYAAGREPYL